MSVDQLRKYLTGHVVSWSRRRGGIFRQKSAKSLLDLQTRSNTLRSMRGAVRRPRPYGVTVEENRRRREMLEPRRHPIIAVSDHLQHLFAVDSVFESLAEQYVHPHTVNRVLLYLRARKPVVIMAEATQVVRDDHDVASVPRAHVGQQVVLPSMKGTQADHGDVGAVVETKER